MVYNGAIPSLPHQARAPAPFGPQSRGVFGYWHEDARWHPVKVLKVLAEKHNGQRMYSTPGIPGFKN